MEREQLGAVEVKASMVANRFYINVKDQYGDETVIITIEAALQLLQDLCREIGKSLEKERQAAAKGLGAA